MTVPLTAFGPPSGVSPRQRNFLHMALTGTLFVSYLTGAYCGAIAGMRYELVAMLIPLGVLSALTLYSAVRPFVQLPEEEW